MATRLVVSTVSFVALLAVCVAPVASCEKHLNGHQNSAETNSEVQGR